MVVEELYMVEEDLRLYRFPCKGGREPVAVGVNRGEAALANGERRVAKYREIVGWQFKELAAFFFPQFLNGNLVDVVRALGILLAPLPEILIEVCKGSNFRHRDESVAAAVTNLVFHIAFFVAGCRIAEVSLKTVMQHETVESIRKNTLCSLEHLCNGCRHVVKPQSGRDAADMLKDPFHPFQ